MLSLHDERASPLGRQRRLLGTSNNRLGRRRCHSCFRVAAVLAPRHLVGGRDRLERAAAQRGAGRHAHRVPRRVYKGDPAASPAARLPQNASPAPVVSIASTRGAGTWVARSPSMTSAPDSPIVTTTARPSASMRPYAVMSSSVRGTSPPVKAPSSGTLG